MDRPESPPRFNNDFITRNQEFVKKHREYEACKRILVYNIREQNIRRAREIRSKMEHEDREKHLAGLVKWENSKVAK